MYFVGFVDWWSCKNCVYGEMYWGLGGFWGGGKGKGEGFSGGKGCGSRELWFEMWGVGGEWDSGGVEF